MVLLNSIRWIGSLGLRDLIGFVDLKWENCGVVKGREAMHEVKNKQRRRI